MALCIPCRKCGRMEATHKYPEFIKEYETCSAYEPISKVVIEDQTLERACGASWYNILKKTSDMVFRV